MNKMCPCQIYNLNIRLKVNIKYYYTSVSLTSSPSPGTPVNVWPAHQSRRAEDLLSIRASGVSKPFHLNIYQMSFKSGVNTKKLI